MWLIIVSQRLGHHQTIPIEVKLNNKDCSSQWVSGYHSINLYLEMPILGCTELQNSTLHYLVEEVQCWEPQSSGADDPSSLPVSPERLTSPYHRLFIHSFILNIYKAPLQENYSEALPTPAR